MIKSIIFDFDGTLVNTNDVIIEAWQHTYRHYGQDEKPVEHITKCFGEPLLVTMAREFPQVDPEESAQVYRDPQIAKAEELVTLFDDIPDLLSALREAGYKIGIVTSRTRQSTLGYLRQFKITEYFDGIVTCDDTDKHKPDPAPVLMGLKKLDTAAEEALMIGDSSFDMKSANNAGVKTVLVGWRVAAANEDVGECTVNYSIARPMDLMEILKEM